MKLRIRKMPRPLLLSTFSGAQQSGSVEGSKPPPSSLTRMAMPGGVSVVQRRELDVHALGLVIAVPVLDRIDHRLAHGHADPVDRLVIQARLPADVVAHDLDEIEHVEGAAEVETDGVSAGHLPDRFN